MSERPPSVHEAGDPSANLRSGLLSAFGKLLKPLIRILIRHGISYAEFGEVVKTVYVETASRDFALPGRKSSGSRVAILTGLTRKEVKRILDNNDSEKSRASSNLSRAGRVLTGWHNDPDFQITHYGIPRDLPFDHPHDSTFSELVRRYSGDMPARAMLEELKRVGAVATTPDGMVHVVSRSYIPTPLDSDSIARIGITLHDLADTLDYNLDPEREGRPRFERRVYTTEGVSKDHAEAFQDLVQLKGQQFLETLDNWLTSRESENNKSVTEEEDSQVHIGVGIYLFEKEEQ